MAAADDRFNMKVRSGTSGVAAQLAGLKEDGVLEVTTNHWLVKALPAHCPANLPVHETSMRVLEAVFGPAILLDRELQRRQHDLGFGFLLRGNKAARRGWQHGNALGRRGRRESASVHMMDVD